MANDDQIATVARKQRAVTRLTERTCLIDPCETRAAIFPSSTCQLLMSRQSEDWAPNLGLRAPRSIETMAYGIALALVFRLACLWAAAPIG
jgi:hypothetical protein